MSLGEHSTMIVVMRGDATEPQLQQVIDHIYRLGLEPNVSRGAERTVVGLIGRVEPSMVDAFEALPGVDSAVPISKPYKQTSREFNPLPTVIRVGDVTIGGGDVVMMAGPCTVETERQTLETAEL